MRTTRLLSASLLALLLSACGGGIYVEVGDPAPPLPPVPQPNPQPNAPTQNCSTAGLAAAAQSRWPVVCMLTSSGELVIELYDEYAPITVANFLAHVNTNYYRNTLVHRVDKDFVVQGGGYSPGMVRKPNPFAPIQLEDNTILSNLRGTIAMARSSDPNSATSEWFLNVRDNTGLDGTSAKRGYAIFGKIISGLPVLDAMNIVPVYRYTDTDLRPRTEILTYWVQRVR
ncbi:peptidylprolyl isomerase [Inhella sp.]|uniref:peptidylprolyl isomerase n=1 Tax=Inhella sp. TaxID=1921806 RepID=UPI0035B273D6